MHIQASPSTTNWMCAMAADSRKRTRNEGPGSLRLASTSRTCNLPDKHSNNRHLFHHNQDNGPLMVASDK